MGEVEKLRKERLSYAGFSLIELMAVLALIALMVSLTFLGFKVVKRSQVSRSASDIAAMLRYGYTRALATSSYFQLRMNLNEQWYQLEQVSGVSFGEEKQELQKKEGSLKDANNEVTILKKVFLKGGPAIIKKVYVPWQVEPYTFGMVVIRFYPDGYVKKSFLCVESDTKDYTFSIETKELTGRVVFDAGCELPVGFK